VHFPLTQTSLTIQTFCDNNDAIATIAAAAEYDNDDDDNNYTSA